MTGPDWRRNPTIIDDISSAVAGLTELGKAVVGPAARDIRESILLFAAQRGWALLSHESFQQWAAPRSRPGLVWLILDPLYQRRDLGDAVAVRLRRVGGRDGWELSGWLTDEAQTLIRGRRTGILDDVAFRGNTLRHVSALVRNAGGTPSVVAVAAATAFSRDAVSAEVGDAEWMEFAPGDRSAIHLRDACPCLPFSGRPLTIRPPIPIRDGDLAVAVPQIVLGGGPWGEVRGSPGMIQKLQRANRRMVDRFDMALGRPALVEDIPLLGEGISVPLLTRATAEASTPLAEIVAASVPNRHARVASAAD